MAQTSSDRRARWERRSMPADLAERYTAEGWWNDATLGSMVADGLGRMQHLPFRVRSQVRPWRGTYAEVDRAARAMAATLRARGVGPGDVVVLQLPNRVEAGIAFWATAVPVAVTERATRLGITCFRSYGSTEHPSITGCLLDEPEVKRLTTDGQPLPGVEALAATASDGKVG